MSDHHRKLVLAHGPDGMIVNATATGFDSVSDLESLRQLREAIDGGARVLAFDNDITVEHITPNVPTDDDAEGRAEMRALAEVIGSHRGVSFVVNEAAGRDWYKCSCGGTFDGRQWPSKDVRGEREPETFGPTKNEHIAESALTWLKESTAAREQVGE